jgi:hypothetical protein
MRKGCDANAVFFIMVKDITKEIYQSKRNENKLN